MNLARQGSARFIGGLAERSRHPSARRTQVENNDLYYGSTWHANASRTRSQLCGEDLVHNACCSQTVAGLFANGRRTVRLTMSFLSCTGALNCGSRRGSSIRSPYLRFECPSKCMGQSISPQVRYSWLALIASYWRHWDTTTSFYERSCKRLDIDPNGSLLRGLLHGQRRAA